MKGEDIEMSNRKSNYPNAQQVDAAPGEIAAAVEKMAQLRVLSRPHTDDEIENRVKFFFKWCADNDIRPGVELMALALGTTRQTLWKWQQDGGRKGEIITLAKQVLAALIENWGQTGKINPAALCFIMKNNFGYSDNVQLEVTPRNESLSYRSAEEIAADYGMSYKCDGGEGEPPEIDF